MFEAAVDTYPETIACRSQNQPLGSVFWPTKDNWDSPSVEKYKIGMKMVKLVTGYESMSQDLRSFEQYVLLF